MEFEVKVSEVARSDILEAASFIALDSPKRAHEWVLALEELFASLTTMPKRFPRVPEIASREYREARHYSHRVVFKIDDRTATVFVVRVYHVARKPLDPESGGMPQSP